MMSCSHMRKELSLLFIYATKGLSNSIIIELLIDSLDSVLRRIGNLLAICKVRVKLQFRTNCLELSRYLISLIESNQ